MRATCSLLIAVAMGLSTAGCASKKELKLELSRETVVTQPDIGGVTVSPTGRIDTREGPQRIDVEMRGDANLEATFDAVGQFERRPMEEVEPGVYRGSFVVPEGATGELRVVGRLFHPPSGALREANGSGSVALFRSPAPEELGCTKSMRDGFDQKLKQIELLFVNNEADLSASNRAKLEAEKSLLLSQPLCRVYVLGHASEEGEDSYNFLLSTFRALAVYKALQEIGLPTDRLERNFLGEKYPAVPGNSPAAHVRNRRVELRAVYPY